jgi:tripeptide aminopeptidase
MLVSELRALGLDDAHQDSFGLVWATVPATADCRKVVAFNAHLDTSPETSGLNVKPKVIENFDGNDIQLAGNSSQVISAATCPELTAAKGKTIVTTDGTTLLGADDKAGVAIIMELASLLMAHRDIPHGPVRLLFTCDEEIGRGVDHVDLKKLNATACYTFDGGGQDIIDNETFSADLALVTITGVNIHPAIAKDKMVNSIRAASAFLARLPRELSPERTDKRDGFLHPYVVDGSVAKTTIKILLRSFDTQMLAEYANLLDQIGAEIRTLFPGVDLQIEFRKQYRNMGDGLSRDPRALQFAIDAHHALGRTPELQAIRGGTDGSRLTELGLPTPNLSSGQHNIHSPLEWACLDEMVAACEIGVQLVKRWGQTN